MATRVCIIGSNEEPSRKIGTSMICERSTRSMHTRQCVSRLPSVYSCVAGSVDSRYGSSYWSTAISHGGLNLRGVQCSAQAGTLDGDWRVPVKAWEACTA
jgi:hypothetical protein